MTRGVKRGNIIRSGVRQLAGFEVVFCVLGSELLVPRVTADSHPQDDVKDEKSNALGSRISVTAADHKISQTSIAHLIYILPS